MLQLVLTVQGVVDMQDGPARIAEDVFDPLILKRMDKYFRAGQFQTDLLLLSIAGCVTTQEKSPR
jgi:hypothetical protein